MDLFINSIPVKHMNLMMETVATAHSEYANMEWLPLPAGMLSFSQLLIHQVLFFL
jgi:roadblock/LC7 domain-containing protein